MTTFKKNASLTILLLALCSFSLAAKSTPKLTPSVSVATSYTDNLFLTQGSDKESEIIAELTPRIRIDGEGKRLRHTFDYQIQSISYADNHEHNETKHQYDLDVHSELIEDLFFLDLGSNFTQRSNSLASQSDRFNLSPSANTNDVMVHSVNPYTQFAIKNTATARLSYIYSKTDFDEEEQQSTNDSNNKSIEATLESGPRFDTWSWSIDYTHDSEESDTTQQNTSPTFEHLRFTNYYKLSLTTALIGIIGYEKNEYQTANLTQDTEGREWQLGARWTPTDRSRFETTAGQRYYGDTLSVSLLHNLQYASFFLDYNESVTTTNFVQSQERVINTDGSTNFIPVIPSSGVNAIITKNWVFRASTKLRKTTLGLQLTDSKIENQQSLDQTDIQQMTLSAKLDLSPRSQVETNLYWAKETQRTNARQTEELLETTLGFRHRVGRNTDFEAEYSYSDQDSSNRNNGYNRNIIHLSINTRIR